MQFLRSSTAIFTVDASWLHFLSLSVPTSLWHLTSLLTSRDRRPFPQSLEHIFDRGTSKITIVPTNTIFLILTTYRTPARLRSYFSPTKSYLGTVSIFLPCQTATSLKQHHVLWAPEQPNLTIIMATSNTFTIRDDSLGQDDSSYTPEMANTIISVLGLIALLCFCFGGFFFLRRRRQQPSASLLPIHSKSAHHRQLSISTTFDGPRHSSLYVYDEKRNLIANALSPASGSVPEIRITFPDEEGTSEKTCGGRVVVVKVGDSGTVGMEPLQEEFLPPYQTNDNSRFQSLDLNRIGGIKEPERFA